MLQTNFKSKRSLKENMALSQTMSKLILKQQESFEKLEGVLKNLRKLNLASRNVKNGQRYWQQATEFWSSFAATNQELMALGEPISPSYTERCYELIKIYGGIKESIINVGVEIADKQDEHEALRLEVREEVEPDLTEQLDFLNKDERQTGTKPKPPPKAFGSQELFFTPPDPPPVNPQRRKTTAGSEFQRQLFTLNGNQND